MTSKFYPYDNTPHGADPRHFDQIEEKSWCLCGEWHWPHPIIRHNLNEGYRHLECRSFTADGGPDKRLLVCCTEHVGHQGNHGCLIGNDDEGWRRRTWKADPGVRAGDIR